MRRFLAFALYGVITGACLPAQAVVEGAEYLKSCSGGSPQKPSAPSTGDARETDRQLPNSQVNDALIIPGDRMGDVRLTGNLDDVIKIIGGGTEAGQGFWTGSLRCTWDSFGLWIVADKGTGNILWISIDRTGSSDWASRLSTVDDIRLGMKRDKLLATMGPPERQFTASGATSYYYDLRGIRLTVADYGPFADTVASIRIVWPSVVRGDALIIPGQRISTADVGASPSRVLEKLGGGYLRLQDQGAFVYYWPHLGLSLVETSGHVNSVRAVKDQPSDAASIRYATVEGVGLGSSTAEVISAFGKPSDSKQVNAVNLQIYRSRGIAIGYGLDSRVRLVDVFPSEGQ